MCSLGENARLNGRTAVDERCCTPYGGRTYHCYRHRMTVVRGVEETVDTCSKFDGQ